MEQYMPFIWIGFALLMAVCEAFTVQLVSIWFVIGAIAAAVSTIFVPSPIIQSAIFIAVSVICLAVTRPLVKKITKRKAVSTNADSLVGKCGIVTIDIDNNSGQGQLNVEGKIWSARTLDNTKVKKGEKVEIKSIQGVKLMVTPCEN